MKCGILMVVEVSYIESLELQDLWESSLHQLLHYDKKYVKKKEREQHLPGY